MPKVTVTDEEITQVFQLWIDEYMSDKESFDSMDNADETTAAKQTDLFLNYLEKVREPKEILRNK